MSTLESLSLQQENYLYDELKDKLLSCTDKKNNIWPERFIKSNKIIQDLTEKELKVLDIDYGSLIKKIALHNPEILFCGKIQDTRYDFGPGPKQISETLRMRRKKAWKPIPEQHLLTIKKENKSDELKERPEFEVPISKHQKFNEMFRQVGLLPLPLKEKVRQSYKIHDVKKLGDSFEIEDIILDLDAYYESITIPPLLEIEGKNRDVIMNWIRILGLENKERVNWSSRQMLKHYKQWPTQQSGSTTKDLAQTLLQSSQNGNGKNGKYGKDKKTGSKK